jgi:riboflavin kinase/FMN adenylyltransferase
MQIIRDVSHASSRCKQAVIALGNFDGVHRGHQAILHHAKTIAAERDCPLAAMTFEPHPREFLGSAKDKIRIYPFRRKVQLFKRSGVEHLFALRFNHAFSQMSAQDFVTHILHEQLRAAHIVTGYNFFFGHGRQGDKDFLATQARILGFGYTAHEPVLDDAGQPISSSRIRSSLKEGNTTEAAKQLGRPYAITGHVIHGDKRGSRIGFPTANIHLRDLFLPRFGVYAVRIHTEKNTWLGVANLGIRPTYALPTPMLEVHLFDFSGDLYGQRLEVELLHFIREEKRFDGLDALTAQIHEDALHAKTFLAKG